MESNHIVFCATSLDCTHKFHNYWCFSRLVGEINNKLRRKHHLSVIENPQNKTVSYGNFLWNKKGLTHSGIGYFTCFFQTIQDLENPGCSCHEYLASAIIIGVILSFNQKTPTNSWQGA